MDKVYTVHGHLTFDGKDIPFTCDQEASSKWQARKRVRDAFLRIELCEEKIPPAAEHFNAYPLNGYYSTDDTMADLHTHKHHHDDGSKEHMHSHTHEKSSLGHKCPVRHIHA